MIENVLIRAGVASLLFTLSLGTGVAIACSVENVVCAVPSGHSAADVAVGELAIAFGVAFVTSLIFELSVARARRGSVLFDVLYSIVLLVPLLVPYCLGTGCKGMSALWFPMSLVAAAVIAGVARMLVRAWQLKQQEALGHD